MQFATGIWVLTPSWFFKLEFQVWLQARYPDIEGLKTCYIKIRKKCSSASCLTESSLSWKLQIWLVLVRNSTSVSSYFQIRYDTCSMWDSCVCFTQHAWISESSGPCYQKREPLQVFWRSNTQPDLHHIWEQAILKYAIIYFRIKVQSVKYAGKVKFGCPPYNAVCWVTRDLLVHLWWLTEKLGRESLICSFPSGNYTTERDSWASIHLTLPLRRCSS